MDGYFSINKHLGDKLESQRSCKSTDSRECPLKKILLLLPKSESPFQEFVVNRIWSLQAHKPVDQLLFKLIHSENYLRESSFSPLTKSNPENN